MFGKLPLHVHAHFRSPAAPLDSMLDRVADRWARVMPSPGKETHFERRFLMAAARATRDNAKPAERERGQ
jgi:hypothetical protein